MRVMEGGLRWARASPSFYGGAMSVLKWNVNFQKRSAPNALGYKNEYVSLLASLNERAEINRRAEGFFAGEASDSWN